MFLHGGPGGGIAPAHRRHFDPAPYESCSSVGVAVADRHPMPCPAHDAWALHKAWPEADFHLIEGAGYACSEPGILDQLIHATDLYAGKSGDPAPLKPR